MLRVIRLLLPMNGLRRLLPPRKHLSIGLPSGRFLLMFRWE